MQYMVHTLRSSPYSRSAALGGGLVFVLAIFSAYLIGSVYSDTQARGLIEAMAPSARTLCFAVITASATIIPLMMALLSFSRQVDNDFELQFFDQLKLIVLTSSGALVLSVIVLLMLTIPLTESEALRSWFSVAYYLLIFGVSMIAGLIVAVVIMLYRTLTDLIHLIQPSID